MKPNQPEAPLSSTRGARGLDSHLVGSIAWTAGIKWASQILAWASMLVLARLLTPYDFGLVGMAEVYLGLVGLISEFGLGTAIITMRDLSDEQVSELNSASLFLGFIGLIVSCGAAIPLGWFFRAPRLPTIVMVMSLSFVILAFRTVPYSLLQKDLRFKAIAITDGLRAVVQALIMVVLALMGFQFWALVLGGLAGAAATAAVTMVWRFQSFRWPRYHSIKRALEFSRHVLVARLSWYGYSNADFMVAGRVLGEAPLGSYTFAWNIASVPVEKITALVTQVTPAFFSAVQTDQAALRRYLRTLTEGLALITFPATCGLALVAADFVHLALGAKWEGVIVPLELLAIYASLRSIVTLLPQVLIAVNESRFVMRATLGALFVLPCAFYVGSHWGTAGIASGWVIAYPFVTLPLYWRTFRKIQMSVSEYVGALWPAFTGTAVMAAAVALMHWFIPMQWQLSTRFGLKVAAGAAVYSLTMMLFHRERVLRFLKLVKTARG